MPEWFQSMPVISDHMIGDDKVGLFSAAPQALPPVRNTTKPIVLPFYFLQLTVHSLSHQAGAREQAISENPMGFRLLGIVKHKRVVPLGPTNVIPPGHRSDRA